ncbi:MAG TPA: hypothetical protein VMH91_04180 [Candidatus Paceibacterota bacterium]|nr:hypothetical protein [Candidatus Paceibacterota bacterium]
MLIPRVRIAEKTFGPCAFEQDQREVTEDLCKIRSARNRHNAKCEGCTSPFRLCKTCIKHGVRHLVKLTNAGKGTGQGLCVACEELATASKKKVLTPEHNVPPAQVPLRLNPQIRHVGVGGLEVKLSRGTKAHTAKPPANKRAGKGKTAVEPVAATKSSWVVDEELVEATVGKVPSLPPRKYRAFQLFATNHSYRQIASNMGYSEASAQVVTTQALAQLALNVIQNKYLKRATVVAVWKRHVERYGERTQQENDEENTTLFHGRRPGPYCGQGLLDLLDSVAEKRKEYTLAKHVAAAIQKPPALIGKVIRMPPLSSEMREITKRFVLSIDVVAVVMQFPEALRPMLAEAWCQRQTDLRKMFSALSLQRNGSAQLRTALRIVGIKEWPKGLDDNGDPMS